MSVVNAAQIFKKWLRYKRQINVQKKTFEDEFAISGCVYFLIE